MQTYLQWNAIDVTRRRPSTRSHDKALRYWHTHTHTLLLLASVFCKEFEMKIQPLRASAQTPDFFLYITAAELSSTFSMHFTQKSDVPKRPWHASAADLSQAIEFLSEFQSSRPAGGRRRKTTRWCFCSFKAAPMESVREHHAVLLSSIYTHTHTSYYIYPEWSQILRDTHRSRTTSHPATLISLFNGRIDSALRNFLWAEPCDELTKSDSRCLSAPPRSVRLTWTHPREI